MWHGTNCRNSFMVEGMLIFIDLNYKKEMGYFV